MNVPNLAVPHAIDGSTRRQILKSLAATAAWPIIGGCGEGGGRGGGDSTAVEPRARPVVVYSALDREFSEPILDDYTSKTRVKVLPKFDIESTKTVGLTNLLITESERPRCDLFWNNEILNTLRLKKRGLLQAVDLAAARPFPDAFKDQARFWHGFAGRARVLLVNTSMVPDSERPRSIHDLTDTKWKGKLAIAKPLFGTTATQATCLFAAWGPDKARGFFRALKANDVQVVSGNKQSARAVGSGEAVLGLTDTDDALGEIAEGKPVAVVYLDREPGQLGTLFIPNTLAVIRNAPNPTGARELAEYLLSPAVEAALARGPSGQIPLNPEVTETPPSPVESPRTVHPMTVDWEAAVDLWDEAVTFLTAEFGA
ncbi:MAG: extracellular solute-binding protein [Isosphaeraceae bacterium]